MVILGWRRIPIILGTKIEDCLNCGSISEHVLLRQTWWFSLFFVPVLLLRFKHSMVCPNCGAETGIPVLQMLRATRDRTLPLERQRPHFDALPPDESGFKPSVAQYFDPVTPNPKRTLEAWYVMIWPVLCAGLIAAIIVVRLLFPPPTTPLGQGIDSKMQDRYGAAHDCWLEGDEVVGCKLKDGTLAGSTTETLTVCYFDEPIGTRESFYCDE